MNTDLYQALQEDVRALMYDYSDQGRVREQLGWNDGWVRDLRGHANDLQALLDRDQDRREQA